MDGAELRALLARGGAAGVLDELYRTFGDDVRRFVRVRLGARPDVEDVCQEVWAAVARMLPTYRGEVPVRAWLLGIARHKTVDVWRKGGGLQTLDSQISEGGPLASALGLRAARSPSRVVSQMRRGAALRLALQGLRPDDRELLELRFVLGLKPAEIGAMLDPPVEPNTVAQRVLRATRRLREALERAGLGKGTS